MSFTSSGIVEVEARNLTKAKDGGRERRDLNLTETIYHVGSSLFVLGSKYGCSLSSIHIDWSNVGRHTDPMLYLFY